jgi:hypothetical protein
MVQRSTHPIDQIEAQAFTVPTDAPEADGTISWNRTTIVIVQVFAGQRVGLVYTYSSDVLAQVLKGEDAFAIPRHWSASAGGAIRSRSRHRSILRALQAGCASRIARTRCSIKLSLRPGELCGRRDWSASSLLPAAQRRNHVVGLAKAWMASLAAKSMQ